MTNISLEKKLNEIGFELIRSDVGDRNVFNKMKRIGSPIGGEPSGHIILDDYCNSGDGILTSLMFLKAIEYLSITPDEIHSVYKPFPQKTIGIPVRKKKDIKTWDTLQKKIKIFNEKFGKNSRLVIRYSGTEPKIRIMVESEYSEIVKQNIDDFKKYISSEIGGEL
jgi:phosphoglucosamine mutase